MAAPLIRSRSNAVVRRFRALKERSGGDLALLEGTKLVEEALAAAEAAGATGAYLAEGCADPFSWKALRGSMGSVFRLPHLRRVGARETLKRLDARGVVTVAATSSGEMRYDQVDLTRPVALVLGNEGAGLDPELLAAASARVAIPMRGGVESLNVAVAAGVLLFEAAR